MHQLTLPHRLELTEVESVEAGTYLAPDSFCAQMMLLLDKGATMTPLTERRDFGVPDAQGQPVESWNGKRILIQRAGGFGDLTLMTPVLREIKRRWPTCHIGISCIKTYSQVLSGLDYVDEILPFPVLKSTADTFDAWIFYENAIESNPRAHEVHMTSLFAEIAGLDSVTDLKPDYRMKPSEIAWAAGNFPRKAGLKRVTMQPNTSGLCRRYPPGLLGGVCFALDKLGWEVFMLGVPGDLPKFKGEKLPENFHDLTVRGLTFRQSTAIMESSDCFVGSDSSILHVAGALNIPAVGLYGAFPWQLRTAHSPSIYSIQGQGACSPCFHHTNNTRQNHFPKHCPSQSLGFCEVLATIKPMHIVTKVTQIAKSQP